ncbi:MAG: carbohydrate ABC transporter permease, partial [Mobilitalea sp.]
MVINSKQKVFNVIIHICLIMMSFIMIMPFVLLFISSITEEITLIQDGYSFFPSKLSFSAYEYLINSGGKIMRAYGMTFVVTIAGTIMNVLISALLAYG